MENIDFLALGTLAIRLLNAILWTKVGWEVLHKGYPMHPTVRKIVTTVIIFGMWVFVLGGVAPFQIISSDTIRTIYTAFTAYAALVALWVITTDD